MLDGSSTLNVKKYSIQGRSVLIVDETNIEAIMFSKKREIAIRLANPDYGIGSSVVTFVLGGNKADLYDHINKQDPNLAKEIVSLLDSQEIDFSVLSYSFLPSGQLLMSCPEAHCAIAMQFHNIAGREDIWVIDGLAFSKPTLHYIYHEIDGSQYNVVVGKTEPIPNKFTNRLYQTVSIKEPQWPGVEVVKFNIPFPSGINTPISFFVLSLQEPCAVCFTNGWIDEKYINRILLNIFSKPLSIQTEILENIANIINAVRTQKHSTQFANGISNIHPSIFNPEFGINVIFGEIQNDHSINARYFIRGTIRENRFMANGAVALTFLAHLFGRIPHPEAEVRGLLSIEDGFDEIANVRLGRNYWWLKTPVKAIGEGDFVV